MIPILGYVAVGLMGYALGYHLRGRRARAHTCCTADTLQQMRSLRDGRAA